MSKRHQLGEANYEEVDGEILPLQPDVPSYMTEMDHREVGHTIARAYELFPDQLTKEVFPSDDMDKAYRISRRLLELDDHEWPKNEISTQNPNITEKQGNAEVKNNIDEVKFTIVGKYGDKLRAEYDGRVLIRKITISYDSDYGIEKLKEEMEYILRRGGGRTVPKKRK